MILESKMAAMSGCVFTYLGSCKGFGYWYSSSLFLSGRMEGHVIHSHIKKEVSYYIHVLKNIVFDNLNLEWKCNVSYRGNAQMVSGVLRVNEITFGVILMINPFLDLESLPFEMQDGR